MRSNGIAVSASLCERESDDTSSPRLAEANEASQSTSHNKKNDPADKPSIIDDTSRASKPDSTPTTRN